MPFLKWRVDKAGHDDGQGKSKRGRNAAPEQQDQRANPVDQQQQSASDDDTAIVYLPTDAPNATVIEVLKSINNNEIQIVTTEEECVTRITAMADKKIFLVLDNPPSKTVLESLNSLPQVDSVIVHSTKPAGSGENPPAPASRAITRCEDPQSLANAIQSARSDLAKQTAAFSVYNQKEKSTRDLSKESGSFLFFQMFKAVLMDMPKTAEAKQMMVSKCRDYYRGNLVELANINEFDLTYKSDEAIQWYTKECFLYRFINKALRTEDVDVLYHFRFYIIDLCKHLELKYAEMKSIRSDVVKLYRGLCLSPTEVENFQRNIGNLISTNGYLSTSYDRSVAYGFATKPNNRTGVVRALFEYQVDITKVKNIVLADIAKYSAFPEEAEMLVDIGASFRIESCTYDPADNLYHVTVQATDQGAALAAEYIEYQKKKMMDANNVLMFGHLLLEMGEYEKAGKYFDNILNSSQPNDEEIACVYFNFGRTHRLKDSFEDALTCYYRAYDLHANARPKRLASAAKALNGLGITYCALKRQEQAAECFEKALQLFQRSVRKKHVDIAGTLINLSTIQYERKQYDLALSNTLKAQKIFEDALPAAHPNNAVVHATLGNIYFGHGDLDFAIDSYQRALKLQMTSLPADHPDITRTLHNIGMAYARRGDVKLAHDYLEKANNSVNRTKGDDHSLIRVVDRGRNHVNRALKHCVSLRL